MKKKLLLIITILFTFTLCANVRALTLTPDEVPNDSYIVGKHLFTRTPEEGSPYGGTLTTQWIMEASKTDNNEVANKMIYYKALRGNTWQNAINDEDITAPRSFEIDYIDGVKQNGFPEVVFGQDMLGQPGEEYPDFMVEDGEVCAIVHVNSTDLDGIADGFMVYDNSNDRLVKTSEEIDNHMTICQPQGSSGSYYARAYTAGNQNELSSKSNVIDIEFDMNLPTPVLAQDKTGPAGEFLSNEYIIDGGKICSLVHINSDDLDDSLSGFILYNKLGDAVIDKKTDLTSHIVICDTNQTAITLYATTYVEGNDNTYVESGKSNEVTIDFSQLHLLSADRIDASNRLPGDPEGVLNNLDKYDVFKKDDTTIMVVDNGLIPYVGGNQTEPKKWVGMIVDFGVEVQGDGYTVEDIDREQASSWGALSDTAFVLWTITDNDRTITFHDVNDSTRTFDLKIEFVDEDPLEP